MTPCFGALTEYTKFTRPNIYKYFKTKDEILLVILKDDFKTFIATLTKSFKINKLYSLHEITEIWADSLLEHKRLLDIYALLFTVLEKNVSVEALADFKKEMLALQAPLISLVTQIFPDSEDKKIKEFMNVQIILAFGLYPMSQLSNLQKDAIKLSGIEYIPPDFKQTYMSYLYKMMYCLQHSIDI